jgi:hypothetical protein
MINSSQFGLIGGIIAFLIVVLSLTTNTGLSTSVLYTSIGLCVVAGILGISGAAVGKKRGGVLMILGAISVLIGASLLGLISFILLLIGGVLALREKTEPVMPLEQQKL